MDTWLDTLAKDSTNRLSRREVFGQIASGFGAAVLGMVGLSRPATSENCGRLCEECCKNNFPGGGRALAACISACHRGEGICGPIVCPQ